MIAKIIEHMGTMPYVDPSGNEYRYGEFFPTTISPFPYNETIAQEYFPVHEKDAIQKGYAWRESKDKSYQPTTQLANIPSSIKEVEETIAQELIACGHDGACGHQCTKAFRIIPSELQLLKKLNIPIPGLCVNCRHYERLKERNPFKLYNRQCDCDYKKFKNSTAHPHHPEGRCSNKFETTYPPDHPEIVYCEQCYNAEIV